MSDIPSRKILGLNQQTYQRLKLALGLHLRRQVFIAVCDDLTLRDRMANQLVTELAFPPMAAEASGLSSGFKHYPRFVSLQLNLSDPNPIAQIAQWVTQFPPPRSGKRRATLPTVQFLGIENLTRQPVAVQRLFFAHLQSIERNLVALESGLLLWVPQPWFHALPQSAPEFWQCRTGVFEFIGDPTPVAIAPPSAPSAPAASPPPAPATSNGTQPAPAQPGRTNDVAVGVPVLNPTPPVPLRPAPAPTPSPSPQQSPTLPVAPIAKDSSNPDRVPAPTVITATIPLSEKPRSPAIVPTPADSPNSQAPPPPTPKAEPAILLSVPAATESQNPELAEPFTLVHRIEALHKQQAAPMELAEAYRALGNYYRDRIERGEVTPQHLTVAIHAYEQVLVWLPDAAPLWTEVLNDLGNFYWMFSRTTTAENAQTNLQQLSKLINWH
ncbi:MAG: hypothetical protein HC881_06655 [Leptolyngbyaceae cyanobacterium SL_7_1]|nr:hypothetical protein [Leptolyngbyaceae cyanobacterium SL_7_1]